MTRSAEDLFSDIRSLAHGTPSLENFARICRITHTIEQVEPGAFRERYLAYTREQLARWPLQHCVLAMQGYQVERTFEHPWFDLARGIKLFQLGNSPAQGLAAILEMMPQREHVELHDLSIRKAAFLDALDAGLLDGLRSITIASSPLRSTTFDEILPRLARIDTLEHLRLERCEIKAAQLETLCNSPLIKQLRTLGLSHNTGVKSSGVKLLASKASEFDSLERLELVGCGLTSTAIKTLATIKWPAGLKHLALRENNLKSQAFKALHKVDMLGLLVDREGPVTLDLSQIPMQEASFKALVDADILHEVEELYLRYCNADTMAPLLELEELPALRVLDLERNAFSREEQEAIADWTEGLSLTTFRMVFYDDAILARFLKSSGLARLEAFYGNDGRRGSGVEGMEALLAWPQFEHARVVDIGFCLPKKSEILERALATGSFTSMELDAIPDDVLVDPRRTEYKAFKDETLCVKSNGMVPQTF